MSVIRTKRFHLAGEYNFPNDPNNGALGNVELGIYIPIKALTTGFFVISISTPQSTLGLSEISFGTKSENGTIIEDNLFVHSPIAMFTIRNEGGIAGLQGVDLRANPMSFSGQNTVQIIMNIAVEPILSGRLAFIIFSDLLDI